MDARLEVRTVEERLRAITGRADALAAAATAERQASAAGRGQGACAGPSEAALASAVADGRPSSRWPRSSGRWRLADAERQAAELASQGRDDRAEGGPGQIRELSGELDKVVDSAHGARDGPGGPPDAAGADRRPGRPRSSRSTPTRWSPSTVPRSSSRPADEGQPPLPYDRAAQEQRAQAAQRQLDQLGKVNPLALEEFAALEERHAFLVTQLEDLQEDPPRPADRDQGSRRPGAAGVRRRLRGHRARVRAHLRRAVPRRRGQAGADRARRHARPPASTSRPGRRARR